MTRTSTWLATLALGLGLTSTAMAGDDNGNFMIRLQGTSLVTQDKTKSLTLNGANIQPAYDASVSNEVIPTATLTYFFNKNLAVELLCCFAKHEIDLSGPVNGKVGSMWIFPPALTLQYHFTGMGAFKPYVGAGAQYIHYFKEKGGPAATTLCTRLEPERLLRPGHPSWFRPGFGWRLGVERRHQEVVARHEGHLVGHEYRRRQG